MLNFFKKNLKKTGEDSTVSANALFEEDHLTDPKANSEMRPKLTFHPSWNISNEKKYVFQFLNNDLEALKPNQVSLSGVEIKLDSTNQQYLVTAFVRNSLKKEIKFNSTVLQLIDETGKMLGRKEFDLSQLGTIPANSSMPWVFAFSPEDLNVEELPNTGWKLAFELKQNSNEHRLDLEDSWEKSMAVNDKENLAEFVASLSPPKTGEVNFMGLSAKEGEEGSLHITMLIRNGNTKDINIQNLPLQVEDAGGQVIARGGFTFEHFNVKANTSKPWTFIFPQSLILTKEYDLRKWKAYPIKQ